MNASAPNSIVLLLVGSACLLCSQCRRGGGNQATIPGLAGLGDAPSTVRIETAVAIPEASVKAAANRIAAMANLAKLDGTCRDSRAEVARLGETARSLIAEISVDCKGLVGNPLASELQDTLNQRINACVSACDTAFPPGRAEGLDVYRNRWQYGRKATETESQKSTLAINNPELAKDLGQSDLFVTMSWLWDEMLRACAGGYADPWLNQHAKDSGVQFTGVVKGSLVGQRQAAFEYQSPDPHFLVFLWNEGSGCQMVSPQEQPEITFSQMGAARATAQLQSIVGAALASGQNTDPGGELAALAASVKQRADQTATATRSLKALIASVEPVRTGMARAKAMRGKVESASQDLEQCRSELRRLEDDMKDLRARREQILDAK